MGAITLGNEAVLDYSSRYGIITMTIGASSASYSVNQVYWQSFGCCDKRGDVDNTGSIDVGDLTWLVAYLFQGGGPPPCEEEGDVDGTGSIDVGDLTWLVAYLFQGGAPPPGC